MLLADGNIGIGGDPGRLLDRCRDLLGPDGDVIVELEPPGTRSWTGPVSLGYRGGSARRSRGRSSASTTSARSPQQAAMSVRETWTEAGRWFARIARA